MNAPVAVPKRPPISDAERERRALAIECAAGHSRMEGLQASAFVEDLERQYVAGEIEIEDAIAAVKRHYHIG